MLRYSFRIELARFPTPKDWVKGPRIYVFSPVEGSDTKMGDLIERELLENIPHSTIKHVQQEVPIPPGTSNRRNSSLPLKIQEFGNYRMAESIIAKEIIMIKCSLIRAFLYRKMIDSLRCLSLVFRCSSLDSKQLSTSRLRGWLLFSHCTHVQAGGWICIWLANTETNSWSKEWVFSEISLGSRGTKYRHHDRSAGILASTLT